MQLHRKAQPLPKCQIKQLYMGGGGTTVFMVQQHTVQSDPSSCPQNNTGWPEQRIEDASTLLLQPSMATTARTVWLHSTLWHDKYLLLWPPWATQLRSNDIENKNIHQLLGLHPNSRFLHPLALCCIQMGSQQLSWRKADHFVPWDSSAMSTRSMPSGMHSPLGCCTCLFQLHWQLKANISGPQLGNEGSGPGAHRII